jgi:hypothetical protein
VPLASSSDVPGRLSVPGEVDLFHRNLPTGNGPGCSGLAAGRAARMMSWWS